jgi:hypothetical protein
LAQPDCIPAPEEALFTGRIDFRALARPDLPTSTIAYFGPEGMRPQHRLDEIPRVPLQPRWVPPDTE